MYMRAWPAYHDQALCRTLTGITGGIMTTLYIEPIHESGEILQLVRSAIESEVAKLELALRMAVKRLAPFEEKYGVTVGEFSRGNDR